jgi:hypothetical protein
MNKIITLALAASLVAFPVATYAAVVGVSAGGGGGAAAGASGNSLNTGASASTSMALSSKSTYNEVVASNGGASLNLSTVKPATTVHIVKLSSLKGYKPMSATMRSSLAANANVQTLDAHIAANAALSAKLKAAGFTPAQVVAASSTKTAITLIVNDRA